MRFDPLFEPVSDDAPCGPDLEADGDDGFIDYYYDALARLPERYIDTSTGEAFDRKSVDLKGEVKAIGALLERSRDLRLLVLEAQFQILAGQLPGFADCLSAIARLLADQWDNVHPRAKGDPTDRRNTLELLDSRATVVMALEAAPLFKDRRLDVVTWRDYAVGAGKRPARGEGDGGDASAILAATGSPENSESVTKAFEALRSVSECLTAIGDACRGSGDGAFSPNFSGVIETVADMLKLFAEARPDLTGDLVLPDEGDAAGADGAEGAPAAAPGAAATSAPASAIANHATARAALTVAESYFARVEPSAPSFLLVRQARLLIGRPLVEALELLLPEQAERAKIGFGSDAGFMMTMNRMRALSEGLPDASGDDSADIPEMSATNRDEAAALISSVEAYFRTTEPSSPIPVLLFKAKSYLNRDFSAIIGELFAREE